LTTLVVALPEPSLHVTEIVFAPVTRGPTVDDPGVTETAVPPFSERVQVKAPELSLAVKLSVTELALETEPSVGAVIVTLGATVSQESVEYVFDLFTTAPFHPVSWVLIVFTPQVYVESGFRINGVLKLIVADVQGTCGIEDVVARTLSATPSPFTSTVVTFPFNAAFTPLEPRNTYPKVIDVPRETR
jgi:hypothetical protein